MALKFFHIPKPKQFSYKPQYYDERKDEIYRLKQEHGLVNDEEGDYKAELKYKLQRNWRKRSSDSKRERSSSIRLVLILIALLALTYYFLIR